MRALLENRTRALTQIMKNQLTKLERVRASLENAEFLVLLNINSQSLQPQHQRFYTIAVTAKTEDISLQQIKQELNIVSTSKTQIQSIASERKQIAYNLSLKKEKKMVEIKGKLQQNSTLVEKGLSNRGMKTKH